MERSVVTVEHKLGGALNSAELKRLYTLSFVTGDMRAWLDCLVLRYCEESRQDCVYLARNKRGTIIGWLLIESDGRRRSYLNVFVHGRYRRKGIGSLLYRHMRETTKRKLITQPHDKQSAAFFESVGS